MSKWIIKASEIKDEKCYLEFLSEKQKFDFVILDDASKFNSKDEARQAFLNYVKDELYLNIVEFVEIPDKISYSRVDTFNQCQYKYKLKYVDELETLPNYDPDNALVLGQALHIGLQKSLEEAIEYYYNYYPVIDDLHINEAIKLEYLIPKIKALLPDGIDEVKVETDDYVGYLDWLVPKLKVTAQGYQETTLCDLYDFKYSNNVDRYMKSGQLHIYKSKCSEATNYRIDRLFFVFIPKIKIRQKKTEDLYQFRQRLNDELSKLKLTAEDCIVEIQYDPKQVEMFQTDAERMRTCASFEKSPTKLCDWCDYKLLCQNEEDTNMALPKNERREIGTIHKKTMWIYGAPFTGKTYFTDKFPEPLNLNTDGNIKYVTMAYQSIKDEITQDGRIVNRKLAWEVFKDAVKDLELAQNSKDKFKTIVVDLLEDVYEYARIWGCDKQKIEHESDNSFKAYDFNDNEFLRTLKKLLTLDYENIILLSHETSARDLTKKSGDKITKIAPNIKEKLANKIAGMVDIVGRLVSEDGERVLSFKTSEVIFGGGRLTVKNKSIPLEYDELMKVYREANELANAERKRGGEKTPSEKPADRVLAEPRAERVEAEPAKEVIEPTELPARKSRAAKTVETAVVEPDVKHLTADEIMKDAPITTTADNPPVRRVRRTVQ